MNKKFTSLMAAALVAGGLSSSAFAQSALTVKSSEYFQLKNGSEYLVVGESSERDSLALTGEPSALEDINKSLWRISVEAQKDEYGFAKGYKYFLINKVNGGVAMTYADASKDASSYYAPGAVVSAGKWQIPSDWVAGYNPKTGLITFNAGQDFDFNTQANQNLYDAAAKEAVAYKLVKVGNVIKLAKGTADVSKAQSLSEIKTAAVKYHGDFESERGLTFTTVQYANNSLCLRAAMLNDVANEAFDLSFNKDVSSSKVNPFTASSLSAAENDKFFSAVIYGWGEKYKDAISGDMVYPRNSYIEALENAGKLLKSLKSVEKDAASYVKEVKVALNEKGTANQTVAQGAPNKTDIIALSTALNNVKDLLKSGTDAEKALAELLKANEYEYGIDGTAVDFKANEKALNENVAKVNKEFDALVKSVSEAITKYDAAVKAAAAEIYFNDADDFEVDYKDYMIGDKKPVTVLSTLNSDQFVTTETSLSTLSNTLPKVTASLEVSATGYYPIAVVGQKDTYLAVDTNYVAEKEKYLGLTTVKFNSVPVDAQGKRVEKAEDADHFVMVPNSDDNAFASLFKMTIDLTTTKGDLITIYAHAPKPTSTNGTPKYFKDYNDNINYFDDNQKIVIRTLSGVRVASVTNHGEAQDVVKNTKITFLQPKLATKVNDGDIYFIKYMNEAKKSYGKFAAVDPVNENEVAVKAAFNNVPATQWVVEKNNDNYTFSNRDFDVDAVNGKLFIVDEDKLIYSTGRDTIQLEKVDAVKKGHLGYKFISEEIQKISDFVLSATNYANVETPYYLTFDGNKDSLLTATPDKAKALALVPMIKDEKQVTEEYKMNDTNLSKQYYQLIAKDGKDTLYLDPQDRELHVTKVAPVVTETSDDRWLLQFRNINDVANAYEVMIGKFDPINDTYNAEYKLSYNQVGEAVAVQETEATAFVYDLVDNSSDIYKNFGFNGTQKVIISLNGDEASKVTKVGPFASVKRTGLELRAAAKDEDFVLVMDTAFVDHKDNIRYAYYITKPIDSAKFAWNDEKFYMVSYKDSVDAKVSNDTIKYSQDGLTRVGFVPAKRVDADKLAISKVKATEKDTINVTEKLGVTNATFAFAIDENDENAYRIESSKKEYVSYLNGILVIGNKQQAQLFNVTTTELNPTENESIEAEGVKVLGANGSVVVLGAAGKNVTVATVLGKTVASQVIASDNATIAAPAGVVFVTVDGETTKVVVK